MNNLFRNFHNLIFSFVFTIVLTPSLESQNNTSKTDYYNWFDGIINQSNSGLFKGTEYFERFKSINERHQYFNINNFSNGSVIFDGQYYFNISLKYNVFDENLLIRDPNTLNAPIIKLEKDKISEFTIGTHKFINILPDEKNDEKFSGFFEILYKTDSIRLYKKYQKEIIRKTDEKVATYEFKDRYLHVANYQGINYKLKKATDLNTIYKDNKKDIKQLSKKYKDIRKSNPDRYILAILTDLHTIIDTNKSIVK